MRPQYIELMASLPYLANPFVHRRPPISNVQLEKRLSMLQYDDRQLIRQLAQTFYFGNIDFEASDPEIIARSARVIERVEQEDMHEWLLWRMDMRTVIAAMRRRHGGETAAPVGERWGYGRYVYYIERSWNHPSFHLESHFTWLPEAVSLLEERDTYSLEKLLLSAAWDYYNAQTAEDEYGLSAVWLYLMRWDLVERWCSYNAERAGERFAELVESALEAPLQELRKIA